MGETYLKSLIANKGYTMYKTGIVFNPSGKFEDWLRLWNALGGFSAGLFWYIGDSLNFAEGRYGEKYSQALDHTKYDYGTLRNCCWVCSKIPIENRRSELSFAHHMQIARIPLDKQREYLQHAVDELNRLGKYRVCDFREWIDDRIGVVKEPKKNPRKDTFDEWFLEWVEEHPIPKVIDQPFLIFFGKEVWDSKRE